MEREKMQDKQDDPVLQFIVILRDIMRDMDKLEASGYKLATDFVGEVAIPPSLVRKYVPPAGWYHAGPAGARLTYYRPEEVYSVFELIRPEPGDNLPPPDPDAIAALVRWRESAETEKKERMVN
jgi:hypothetical protein